MQKGIAIMKSLLIKNEIEPIASVMNPNHFIFLIQTWLLFCINAYKSINGKKIFFQIGVAGIEGFFQWFFKR